MANLSSVLSKSFLASYRPEIFGDCRNENYGVSAKYSVSFSNAWLETGRLNRHNNVSSSQNQGGKKGLLPCQAFFGRKAPKHENDPEDDSNRNKNNISSEEFRQRMERMVNSDSADVSFRGIDLAILIRKKYGRSYDVQFIKKEFMGRQLLAMNVMWKYREQRSFPLTEEEYLLHLDDIADNLRCWGAVGLVRNHLEKTKERPRIGKAVSIPIDLDEYGERSREWISK